MMISTSGAGVIAHCVPEVEWEVPQPEELGDRWIVIRWDGVGTPPGRGGGDEDASGQGVEPVPELIEHRRGRHGGRRATDTRADAAHAAERRTPRLVLDHRPPRLTAIVDEL